MSMKKFGWMWLHATRLPSMYRSTISCQAKCGSVERPSAKMPRVALYYDGGRLRRKAGDCRSYRQASRARGCHSGVVAAPSTRRSTAVPGAGGTGGSVGICVVICKILATLLRILLELLITLLGVLRSILTTLLFILLVLLITLLGVLSSILTTLLPAVGPLLVGIVTLVSTLLTRICLILHGLLTLSLIQAHA